jgi:hypothetical protein
MDDRPPQHAEHDARGGAGGRVRDQGEEPQAPLVTVWGSSPTKLLSWCKRNWSQNGFEGFFMGAYGDKKLPKKASDLNTNKA